MRAIVRSLLVALGLLLTSAVAFSPTVEARNDRGHRDHGNRGSRWDHHDRGRKHQSHRFVDVPRRMHGHYRNEFRHAYSGRSYYRPHRHHHMIYRYPVVVGGIVRYRPYHYCNDELWVTGHAPLPRVVVGFNIRPGIRIQGGAY